MAEHIDQGFVDQFASAPINADSFAEFFLTDESMKHFPQEGQIIANFIRANQPRTYREFLGLMKQPAVTSLIPEMSKKVKWPLQDIILGTTFRIYTFLRNKDWSLPRSSYRTEDLAEMDPEEVERIEEECERASQMVNTALIHILGVHPADL